MKLIYKMLKTLYVLGITAFIKSIIGFFSELKLFKQQHNISKNEFVFGKLLPCLTDKKESGGVAGGAYFHHDLLCSRRIFENDPEIHVDVGSRIDGFVAHLASFRKLYVMDIRPLEQIIPNVTFIQQNIMGELETKWLQSCDSVSCLSVLEHFGLGRYGDPVNYMGHLVGLENLYRLLKTGGKLYLAVPIRLPQRIEFNAHRVFSVEYLLEQFKGKFKVDMFSYVDDKGNLYENVGINNDIDIKNCFGCRTWFTSGIFELSKL